jgi:hypothetical protein
MTDSKEILDIASSIFTEIRSESKGYWTDVDAPYYRIRTLQIDKRGSFGERFFAESLLKIFHRRIILEYADGDQGDWDLKINNIKFEIKTSSIDVNSKFQNENIMENGDYAGLMFLLIMPDKLFIKFVKKENIPFEILHDRKTKGTGSGYKWDFKLGDKSLVEIKKLNTIKDEFLKAFGGIKEIQKLK